MPLMNLITVLKESKVYRRRLIVRAIEDGIVLLALAIVIMLVCAAFSALFTWLGVI